MTIATNFRGDMTDNLSHSIFYALVCFSLSLLLFIRKKESKLDAVPTVGPSGYLALLKSFTYSLNAPRLIQEGYEKYKGGAFKVVMMNQWVVVVSGPQLIEELRRAPEDQLSAQEAFSDRLQIPYTMGRNTSSNPYHIGIVQSQLTRNLSTQFEDLYEEIKFAFNDKLQFNDGEWIPTFPFDLIAQVVCRAVNRVFVGLPLCRDSDYINLNVEYTRHVTTSANYIRSFPLVFRPFVARLSSKLQYSVKQGLKHLGPVIQHRQKMLETEGESWAQKPNDLLTWLMEAAEGEEKTVRNLTIRILVVNFAAVHTSTHTFTHALYDLISNPQHIEPLRDEICSVIQEEGWTKGAIDRMHKLDSFFRESQRYNGLSRVVMTRKAMQPFTFSNGTVIPVGTTVSTAQAPMHHDELHYDNPDKFDGFRFVRDQKTSGENKLKMVTTGVDYVPFGYGRHACPGRFFAALELKTMMAHILMTYDMKLENGGVRPENHNIGDSIIPNMRTRILFRKRVAFPDAPS